MPLPDAHPADDAEADRLVSLPVPPLDDARPAMWAWLANPNDETWAAADAEAKLAAAQRDAIDAFSEAGKLALREGRLQDAVLAFRRAAELEGE
jgi:hypothetical protein